MRQIALIRIGTYAILLACVFLAKPRHFIEVDIDPWHTVPDRAIPRGGPTPTLVPGFADTRLSGAEIVKLASERVRRERIDPKKLSWLTISLATRDSKLVWVVTWDIVSEPNPVPFEYRVVVDDATREASFEKNSYR